MSTHLILKTHIPQSVVTTVRPGQERDFLVSLSHTVPVAIVPDDSAEEGVHESMARSLISRGIAAFSDAVGELDDAPQTEGESHTDSDDSESAWTVEIEALQAQIAHLDTLLTAANGENALLLAQNKELKAKESAKKTYTTAPSKPPVTAPTAAPAEATTEQ